MNEEQRQRQMDFIVETLARVSVRIDSITEKVDDLAEKVDALADVQVKSEQEREADAVRLARLEEAFVALSQLSQRFVERLDEREARINAHEINIAEHHARLANVENAIVMLTRLVSEGRNGTA